LCTEPCSCGDSRIRRPLLYNMPMVYTLAHRILKSCRVRSADKGLNETKITPQGRYPQKRAFVYKIVNTHIYIYIYPAWYTHVIGPPHPPPRPPPTWRPRNQVGTRSSRFIYGSSSAGTYIIILYVLQRY